MSGAAALTAPPPLGKTLAVILGAQAWPNMDDALKPSDAFALSSGGFKDYLQDNAGLNLPNASIKDLFDSALSKDAIDEEIAKFLQAHYKGETPDFDTLIIYYTGHADFTKGEQHFYLTLRSTSHWNVDFSGYQMGQLAATVNKFARVTRKFVILDCCYAASAFVDWQRQGVGDVETAISLQAQKHFTQPSQGAPPRESGTVLLCACNEDKWALYQDGKPTMFSSGLLQALRTGDHGCGEMLSIDDVMQLTQQCITEENKSSAVKPWLRVAKGSEDALKAAPLFPNPARRVDPIAQRMQAPEAMVAAERVSESASFGPGKLNCLVIESEHARHDSGPHLSTRVRDAFSRAGAAIWTVFRDALTGVEFVGGSFRDLAATYEPPLRAIDVRSIVDVFGSDASLEQAVLAVVRADLAFFDVSIFEPGVMFLLGVRAAIRRGVTLCSHGWGWHEGEPLEKPFNLSDLQIFSHSKIGYVGLDPVVQRFVEAIQNGFRQLQQQPRYQDLPAYDALRELGPGANASGTIPWNEYLLVLCSFSEEHQKGWEYVRGQLEDALQARGTHSPRVQRLIDRGSPQLVSQALYENIRRASACVMDWSYYSPSTFLELGVRLVVSPWGALQIIDERFLPGAALAPHVRLADGPELQQLGKMAKRFMPRAYRTDGEVSFGELLALLVLRRPFDEDEPDYNRIHRSVQKEIGSVSPTMLGAHDMMRRAADTLSDTEQDRRAVSQVLFSGNEDIKRDREYAALEYRISAWLYLEHRAGARLRPDGDRLRETHRSLGQIVAAALYDTGKDADFVMAQLIESLSKSEQP